jgi:hypothetical protein
LLTGLGLILFSTAASAQWVTESYSLKPGWNAIWISHDCSYNSIDNLLAGQPDIVEIWRWNSLGSTVQFTSSPSTPITPDLEWVVWHRGATNNALTSFSANSAYLVRLVDGAQATTLSLTGRPLPPAYTWQSTGLNFLGFPMVSPSSVTQQNFDRFFSYSAVLKTNPTVFFYNGGPLSSVAPKNPIQVFTTRSTVANRGQAYWVQGAAYNEYYGPVSVDVSGNGGLDFGSAQSLASVRLKNVVDPAKNQSVTVTLARASSAPAPSGQTLSAGDVPLLLRGDLDPATGQFAYTPFPSPMTVTIPPGGETQVFIAVNRAALGSVPGADFQSVLQVSDSLGLTRIDLPVHAVATSLAGVWLGAATITQVDQIVGQTATPATVGNATYPIRLLVHMDDGGNTTLLQQVYVAHAPAGSAAPGAELALTNKGYGAATNLIGATRLSSSTFPIDLALPGVGRLGSNGVLTFNVILDHNASTNPFVHTYHPDHDNLDARFNPSPLPAGLESYSVNRAITLNFQSSLAGVSDPNFGSTILGGSYTETITGLRSQPINVSGIFVLRRASAAGSLITQ